jgi:CDP-glycerol glycerophosphotransferase (TagB/SpsB family)
LDNLLDVDQLAADLGEGYVVLLRAHSRTARYAGGERGGRVVDVTTFPDITELFLATDVLVTDYSSVMFDFAVTGRPMVFFVPDLDSYDQIRGSYFRLADTAPGPLLGRPEDVAPAVRDAGRHEHRYTARYRVWQERYVPWDDGQAGRRVLSALFAAAPRSAGGGDGSGVAPATPPEPEPQLRS